MKTRKTYALLAGLVSIVAFVLMSFAPKGGHSYTIHVNHKQVSEQYLTDSFVTPMLTLTSDDLKGTLSIYFNECGEIGKSRKLILKDASQKTLNEWSYANSSTRHDPMEISLKDVSAMLASGKVALYYISERVTKPQILTSLILAGSKGKATSSR